MSLDLLRRSLPRRETRVRLILCCSHYFGNQLIRAFAASPILREHCEIVALWTDNPIGSEAERRIWALDSNSELRNLVRRTAEDFQRTGALNKFEIIQRRYDDCAMLDLIEHTGATALVSATFGGIFSRRVLSRVLGFNFHPAGFLPDGMGEFVPKRYRGSGAARQILRDLAGTQSSDSYEPRIENVVVGVHQLVPAIDQGRVVCWSNPVWVPVDVRLMNGELDRLAGDARLKKEAAQMADFQKHAAVRVFDVAQYALPYMLSLCDDKPAHVASRDLLEPILTEEVA